MKPLNAIFFFHSSVTYFLIQIYTFSSTPCFQTYPVFYNARYQVSHPYKTFHYIYSRKLASNKSLILLRDNFLLFLYNLTEADLSRGHFYGTRDC